MTSSSLCCEHKEVFIWSFIPRILRSMINKISISLPLCIICMYLWILHDFFSLSISFYIPSFLSLCISVSVYISIHLLSIYLCSLAFIHLSTHSPNLQSMYTYSFIYLLPMYLSSSRPIMVQTDGLGAVMCGVQCDLLQHNASMCIFFMLHLLLFQQEWHFPQFLPLLLLISLLLITVIMAISLSLWLQ